MCSSCESSLKRNDNSLSESPACLLWGHLGTRPKLYKGSVNILGRQRSYTGDDKWPRSQGREAWDSERRNSTDKHQKRKVPANRKIWGNQTLRRSKQETKNYDPSHPAAHCHAPRKQQWCLVWGLSSFNTCRSTWKPGQRHPVVFLTAENWTQSLGFASWKYYHWVKCLALEVLVSFLFSILRSTPRISCVLGKSIHHSWANSTSLIF